jgi:hypothetical protein
VFAMTYGQPPDPASTTRLIDVLGEVAGLAARHSDQTGQHGAETGQHGAEAGHHSEETRSARRVRRH